MKNLIKLICFLCFAQFNIGCLTPPSVTFRSDLDTTITAVGWDNLEGAGAKLGSTPITLPLKSIKGKPIRVAAAGMKDQFWIFSDQKESSVDVNLKLRAISDTTGSKCNAACQNRNNRLILGSYEALSRQDTATAKSIANELATVAPGLAAPYLLRGLAHMHANQNKQAKANFVRAKTLDPGDPNIDKLLQAIK